MPDRANLVVVIVGDVGLRCQLAARLSLLDIELLTASCYRQIARQALRTPAILVMDEADLAEPGNPGIEGLRDEGRWRWLAVLTAAVPLPPDQDWPTYVGKASAGVLLPRYIQGWTESAPSPSA